MALKSRVYTDTVEQKTKAWKRNKTGILVEQSKGGRPKKGQQWLAKRKLWNVEAGFDLKIKSSCFLLLDLSWILLRGIGVVVWLEKPLRRNGVRAQTYLFRRWK